MKKVSIILGIIVLVAIAYLYKPNYPLSLSPYYSTDVQDHRIVLTLDRNEQRFIMYIDCRLVNEGTYKKISKNSYILNGNYKKQSINLVKDRSIKINISKLCSDNDIVLKPHGSFAVYYDMEYGDEDRYRALLD